MIQISDKSLCNGCYACYNICPENCISMIADSEGFWYPNVDEKKCIECGLCEKICPIIGKKIKKKLSNDAFAVINTDEETRMSSSSGGVFTLLAENILDECGVVCGAAFSDDFKAVKHIAVETKDQLWRLMGSKYLQSNPSDSYKQAKSCLNDGRKVLFTGTPCQIAGLYAYLGESYENLYTQDIICHGVPSPDIWKNYIEYHEEKASSKMRRIFFRYKQNGWKSYSIKFEFENNAEYVQNISKDLYMRGFLSNLYLRPSCYNCSFKSKNRISDITLADFWGVEKVCPDMYDNKGTSLVIVNSEKGQQLFNSIENQVSVRTVDLDAALGYNSAAIKSADCPTKKRNAFFQELNTIPFSKLMFKFCTPTPKEKIRKAIGRILRKIKIYR